MGSDRLTRLMSFILEVDELKQVKRRTHLLGDGRRENDAEHSWHLALMVILLSEFAAERVDLLRVLKMALIHDIVEIDAGDTFCYDEAGNEDRVVREQAAARRLFYLLPGDLAESMCQLWEEFEARETPEARFAASLDRLQPLLLNYHSGGTAWQENGVTFEQVIEKNRQIARGAPLLWRYVRGLIEDAVRQGFLAEASPRS